jgi:hypothetical protein
MTTQAIEMVRPGFDYYEAKFFDEGAQLGRAVALFEAAELVNPQRIVALAVRVEELLPNLPPSVDAPFRLALLEQLPAYIREATLFTIHRDTTFQRLPDRIWDWWREHGAEIPAWRRLTHLLSLFQPSSAAVERVFSEFKALFNPQQSRTLQDAVQLSVMLRINHRNR